MPTLHKTPLGHVTAIWGSALIRGEDGRMHALKVGDPVHTGDVILTSQNGIVEMTDERGGSRLASLLPPDEANKVIQALDKGEPEAAPSAGLAGGDGSLQPGLRVDRIAESIGTASFHSQGAFEGRAFPFIGAPTGTSVPASPNVPPQATPGEFNGNENTTIPVSLKGSDSDGTVVGITVTSIPAGSTLLLADGQTTVAVGQTLSPSQAANLLFAPAHDFVGHLDIEFTVTDDRGATSTPALTQIGVIAVSEVPTQEPPANDAPIALPDVASTPRGTPIAIDVLTNDKDPNGDALHVQNASVDPALGTVAVNPDGTISFTPAPGATGTVEISYTAADPSGATSTSTATVTLVNHAPLASSSAIEAIEQGVAVNLGLAAPSDADGDALAIVVTALPSIGQVQLADGTPLALGDALSSAQLTGLKYLPPADVNPGDAVGSFGYSVADGHGDSANGTTTIAVTPINDAPVISSDSGAITEGQPPIGGSLTASDADNPGLAFVPATSNGAWGALTVDAAGGWSYALAPASQALAEGQVVVEHFVVALDDGSHTSVTITVTGTDDAPVVSGEQSGSVTEDAVLVASGTLVVADADAGQDGTQAANLAGAYGDLAIDATGHWTYTLRNADANVQALHQGEQVQDHFSVQSSDGTPIAISIAVNGANETPSALGNDASGAEDAPGIPVVLAGSDVDGTIAAFTLTALPAHGALMWNGSALAVGSVVPASGNAAALTFVPDALWHGSTSLSFSATDNDGGTSAPVTQAIVVTHLNHAPLALDDSAATSENTPLTIAVLGNDSDPDGDALVVTGASIASGAGSVAVNADGTLGYDPGNAYDHLAPGATATVQIAYGIADGQGGTSSAVATVTITGTNDGPVAQVDVNALSEDDPPATGNVLANDSDLDDGAVLVVTGVAAGNDPAPAGNVGTSLVGAYGTLVIDADGHYSYTPGSTAQALVTGQSVTDPFSYSITDGQGGSATATLTITVLGADDAPSFGGQLTGDVTEDGVQVATGAISIVDPDAGQSSFQPQAGSLGTYGSFSIDASGVWTYVLNNPAANVQGLAEGQTVSDAFVVTSADGNTRSVVVAVHGTDDAPIAVADMATGPEDMAIAGNVLANDSDIDGGALAVTQFAVGGTTYAAGSTALLSGVGLLHIDADGAYAFMPAANYNGPVPVATYTVFDGFLASTSTLTLAVTPLNDAPLAVNDAFTTQEDTPLTLAPGQLLANDSDPDGDAITITSVGSAVNGNVAIVGGNVVFTPNADYSGPASFAYTIDDGHGLSSSATVSIGVIAVNDPPLAVNDVASTQEDSPLAGNVLVNDSDPDGPSLAVTQFAVGGTIFAAGIAAPIAGVGSLVINANGSYLFTPAPEYSGPVPVATYTISDGQATSSATLTLNVTPVDDVPATRDDACSATEGSNGWLPGNVLANDSDAEGDTLHVSYVATNAASSAVAVDGIATITTALGGTVIMGSNGSYRYIAPARDHADATPDVDSFVYRASDGQGDSAWSTVRIAIDDTTPTANPDSANVAFNGSVTGNLLFNDLSVDAPRSVTSVSFDGIAHTVAPGGSTTIDTPSGLLTVSSDGSYTYTSQLPPTAVLTGGSQAAWEQVTDLYGFHGSGWQSGSNLNLGALDAAAAGQVTWVASGSKPGLGVAGGGNSLGSGEELVVQLHETAVQATIGIAQLNTNQGLGNAHWSAYDASGALVASGDFANAASLNNGNEYTLQLDTGNQAFSYLAFSWGSSSQGYVLSSLSIERLPSNHTESFAYTMNDGDGDLASSTFTVTPAATSSVQGASLDGTAAHDYLVGDARDNIVNGNDGNDVLYGGAGNDAVNGGNGHDYVHGGAGNDAMSGGEGNDIVVGGAGSDALAGGNGADVFAWSFADKGAAGAPAIDSLGDFNLAAPSSGGDVLDLRDLLQNEQHALSLDRYLEFDTTSQPGSTLIHISSGGGFAAGAGWNAGQAAAQDQTIVLQGIADIRGALSLDAAASDNQVIQELVNRGKLLVDHG